MGSRSKARARAKANQQARRASASPRAAVSGAGSAAPSAGQQGGGSGGRPPGQQGGGSGGRSPGQQGGGSAGRSPDRYATAASSAAGPAKPDLASKDPAAAEVPPAGTARTVLAAAVVQSLEALGVLIASAIAAVDTATGHSYHLASGIAITIIGVCMAAVLGLVALGLRGTKRWSRTPAVLTQLFVVIVAIYLLQARRYDWGVPAILLGAGGFASLLAPSSLRLLTPGRPEESQRRPKSNAVK